MQEQTSQLWEVVIWGGGGGMKLALLIKVFREQLWLISDHGFRYLLHVGETTYEIKFIRKEERIFSGVLLLVPHR